MGRKCVLEKWGWSWAVPPHQCLHLQPHRNYRAGHMAMQMVSDALKRQD